MAQENSPIENRSAMDIRTCAQTAGIVGTGGAGFPTHVKISARAEVVIANGAECEPLLETDRHYMLRYPEKVIRGLRLAMESTGAARGIIGVKAKHVDLTALFTRLLENEPGMELYPLQNFYPAGDEHVLVYETTGRVVPAGGIPIEAGAVVNNVFTLGLLADAADGIHYTKKYITVTGEVNRPCVGEVPIGITLREVVETLGQGIKIKEYGVIVGGPMMGAVCADLDGPVTKTTGGIIVLPAGHKLLELKTSDIRRDFNKAKSVCCQCNLCSELCPRNLLGHKLYPSRSMRVLPYLSGKVPVETMAQAALCTDCGLCQVFACTLNLAPNRVHNFYKKLMAENGYKPDVKSFGMNDVGEFWSIRKVPTNRVIDRLGVSEYNRHLPFIEESPSPEVLTLPLKMHIGAPCEPVVSVGEGVAAGQTIAKAPREGLGVDLHAPMAGKVRAVGESIVIEMSGGGIRK